VVEMKRKDLKIKEAQGRKSREIGTANLNKLLMHLRYNPSTFTELEKLKLFSKPVLLKHLRTLKKQGLIQKQLKDDKVIYLATERAVIEATVHIKKLINYIAPQQPKHAINFMTQYILPSLTAETLRLLKTEISKNPQDETLKKSLEKIEAAHKILLESMEWYQKI
jgi:DNA-binding HxlR family transcriptional regulator